jgi:hypothetical protein
MDELFGQLSYEQNRGPYSVRSKKFSLGKNRGDFLMHGF